MNIVVCIKQVLDTTDTRFDQDSGRLKRDGQPTTINALDEHAVEEALRLKEAHGGKVTVLTMGATGAATSLKHTVAMGADEAVHLCDDAFAGADTTATVRVLSHAIAQLDGGVDLVLCGAETMDGNTAFVGPALAQSLQLPYVTFVEKIEEISETSATLHRMMEEGYDRVECPVPALLTVVKGINQPRITSLKGKMKAKKCKPTVLGLADLAGLEAARVGAAGSTSRVVRTFPPEPRPSGVMFEGEPSEIAEKLYQSLK